MLIIISYTKARASNNHSFYVVRYLPDEVGASVVLYLGYIRPFLNFSRTSSASPIVTAMSFFS